MTRSKMLTMQLSVILLTSSCVSTAVARQAPPLAPGLHNLNGWGGQCGQYGCDKGVYNGTAPGADINGEVGHPLSVAEPTANCRPRGSGWIAVHSIVSGSLPPGLSFNYQGNYHSIGGIPTERGHWIVKVAMGTVSCNATNYQGFQQELRFHITGSGQVVQ